MACTGSNGSPMLDQIFLLITSDFGAYISAQHYTSTVGIAVTGLFYSPLSDKIYLGGTANSSRFFVMKLETDGSIDWSIAYLSTYMTYVKVSGMAFNPLNDDLSLVGGPPGGGYEIVRLDSAGNYMWSQGSSGFVEFPSSIIYEPSGSMIISGDSPSSLTTNLNQFHCRLLADGTRCTSTYNTAGTNSGYSANATATSFTTNPSFPILASPNAFTPQNRMLDRVTECSFQVGIDPVQNISSGDIYLKLVSDILIVQSEGNFTGTELLKIYDINGKCVLQHQAIPGTNNYEFNVSPLNRGNYFLSIVNGSEMRTKRFVKN